MIDTCASMAVNTAPHHLPGLAGNDTARWLHALREPRCYPHPVRPVRIIETHISWVLLTGNYAYKIKKPVNLGFLDFTHLKARHHYCDEEVRLNRRLAAELYLGTVAITGTPDTPQIGGPGAAFEYAVKMRQFPQSALLDAALARGKVGAPHFEALAHKIAHFHAALPPLPGNASRPEAAVLAPALDSFDQMLPLLDTAADIAQLNALRGRMLAAYQSRTRRFACRHALGRVRECHGDLHLGNIVLINGAATPFDCIEFNAALRQIDVMSEVAFLAMDLEAHGRRDLAFAFLNAYLEASGDYEGVAVLPFYRAYRALVRAKIGLIRSAQAGAASPQRDQALGDFRRYIGLAGRCVQERRGAVIITHGASGSGKTTVTQPLPAVLGAIRLRSDLERKRLHGVNALARTGSAVAAGIYTPNATQRTYATLARYALTIAAAGMPAIVDGSFLRRRQREALRAVARRLGVPFAILDVRAPPEALKERIASRAAAAIDASEANAAVLEHQLATRDALAAKESRDVIAVNSADETPASAAKLGARILRALRSGHPYDTNQP